MYLRESPKVNFRSNFRISFSSMKGKDIEYDLKRSSFVKPEIQGMLDKATKIGLLKIEKNGKESQESRLCVLTDMGLLVLQVDNVLFISLSFQSLISFLLLIATVKLIQLKAKGILITWN